MFSLSLWVFASLTPLEHFSSGWNKEKMSLTTWAVEILPCRLCVGLFSWVGWESKNTASDEPGMRHF